MPRNSLDILSRAARLIGEAVQSGRPLLYVHTPEEQRVARLLAEVSRALNLPVWTWSLTEGIRCNGGAAAQPGTEDPRRALDFIAAHSAPAIFLLKDFHEPLRESAAVRRRLRDVYELSLDRGKFVVISSPVRAIPEELDRSLLFLDLRPPDLVELEAFIRDESPDSQAGDADFQQVARALQGLTLDETRYALRRALAAGVPLGGEALPALLEEKRLLVNRSGVIEYIYLSTRLDEVGGLEGLKKWLLERRKLFQMRDTLSSEIVPKGLLLMGMPGCGKSLCVKAIASAFQLPLYRIDMVEIFSGRHGKPEGVFVQACRMLEDMAPAVLWFDEIEQGMATTESGNEQGRIFGFFLTWMQERSRGLFVAATANRIDLLPAQLIRKGRFDEVFFVDLPVPEEQVEIFKIHLSSRGVDLTAFNFDNLIKFTPGWSGAEIEQCVISALTRAQLEDRRITEHDVISLAAKQVPLSRTMKEQINQIRGWAFERAIRASPQALGR
jgi:SpoVK/Ycf46/Vps4 family AAA+-type ATPase